MTVATPFARRAVDLSSRVAATSMWAYTTTRSGAEKRGMPVVSVWLRPAVGAMAAGSDGLTTRTHVAVCIHRSGPTARKTWSAGRTGWRL